MPPTPPYTRRPDPSPVGVGTFFHQPRSSAIATMWPVSITAEPFVIELSLRGIYSSSTASDRDSTLDQTFAADAFEIELSLHGEWLNKTFASSALFEIELSLDGEWLDNITIASALFVIELDLNRGGTGAWLGGPTWTSTSGPQSNWVKWSQIGVLDFTQDRSNVAGQMPLPWKGAVWAIKRRGDRIVVYGKNGVATLVTGGTAFGYQTLPTAGLKSKLAVCDTGEAHYFVDSQNRLWKLGQGLELLDYREWIATLGSTIAIVFNPDTRLLYIDDGTIGFVYNVDSGSMGKGPATVTGIGLQDGTLYVVASGTMTIPDFAITTGVEDFGTRKGKTVRYLEAAVDTTLTLQGSADYKLDKAGSFTSLDWYPFDSRGHCYLNCYGYEFRFKVRATSAGWFHLDRLSAWGVTHAH